MGSIIEVKDLHHRYPNGFRALRGVSVTVAKAEFVAIIGQNGSGKTTFVKHLNGLLRATAGMIRINGQNIRKRRVSEMARTVGYCFQNPDHQIFCDTVYKEVAFGPRNLHLSQAELDERVDEALGAVGLLHVKDEMPKDLSKGHRQRVAVASVLSMRPEILIIDEPTTGQDYRDGVEMLNLVQRLNEAGHTILFITHDMPMVARLLDALSFFGMGKSSWMVRRSKFLRNPPCCGRPFSLLHPSPVWRRHFLNSSRRQYSPWTRWSSSPWPCCRKAKR